ncbi:MAG TPA: hypothetical protein VGK19_24465 [Capsulimonadaceae bacterium]|jgi:hypothetical protein
MVLGTPKVTVSGSAWGPDPAYAGDMTYGGVSASIAPAEIDSDGTGMTYVTYEWATETIYYSADGGVTDPWHANGGNSILSWTPDANPTRFWGALMTPGFYIQKVKCTATIHDSRTGDGIGAPVVGYGFIGGPDPEAPPDEPEVQARAEGTPPAVPAASGTGKFVAAHGGTLKIVTPTTGSNMGTPRRIVTPHLIQFHQSVEATLECRRGAAIPVEFVFHRAAKGVISEKEFTKPAVQVKSELTGATRTLRTYRPVSASWKWDITQELGSWDITVRSTSLATKVTPSTITGFHIDKRSQIAFVADKWASSSKVKLSFLRL